MRVFFLLFFSSSFLHGLEYRSELMPYRTINSEHSIETICYSKDGKILFVGTAGRGATSSIELYNHIGEKLNATFTNDVPVDVLDTNPDNQAFACGSNDVCKIWDIETKVLKQLKNNPNNLITSLEYDKEGKRLLIGYKNGTCKIWDVRVKEPHTFAKELHTLEAHDAQVYCARWCPDNSHLATLGADKTIKIWDAKTSGCIKIEKRAKASPVTLAFNSATEELIAAGLNLYVYEPILAFSQVFNLDGKQAPTGGSRLVEDSTKPKARSLAFIPGNKDYIVAGINDGTVCLCNRNDQRKTVVLSAFLAEKSFSEQEGKALAISLDGQTLAVGSYCDGMVRFWKIDELLLDLKKNKQPEFIKSTSASVKKEKSSECCIIN